MHVSYTVKATDQMSSDLDGSKQVKIGNEIHSLDVLPAAESKVVAEEKKNLLGAVDLKTLVNYLGHAGAFIRIAYNGVIAAGPQYTELHIEIQLLGFDITKLCDESALMISKFKRASSMVLNGLEAMYGYLLLNKENVAIETLSSVSKLAGDMERAALALHEKFQKQEEKVKDTLKKTQIARGDAKVRIEEREKEHQQLQIQLQHQQKLLDEAQRLEHEAEAQRLQIEAKEDDAISSIRHIDPLKSLVNALFRYEVFDEGTRKVGLWKEKRIHALEKENMLRKQRYEAMERMTSFAVMIQDCKFEQEMAEVTVDALHNTVGVLQELIAAVMRAAKFWRQMQEHCRSLADDGMLKKMKMIEDKVTKEERKMMWTSEPFKKQAVHFYAGWVALNSLCTEYVEHIKLTQKDLYKYIVENPTYEESRKNVRELAKIFLTDLEKDQKAIAEKEFEAQKEIEALKEE